MKIYYIAYAIFYTVNFIKNKNPKTFKTYTFQDPEVFSSKYGSQNGIKTSTNPYGEEQPYILNGEIILPSKLKQRKAEEIAK